MRDTLIRLSYVGAVKGQEARPYRIPTTHTRVMLAALGVFGISLFAYRSTLSPTINSFDSAELITGAYSLGIVHAPGYPLYLLTAHLAARIPWGTIPQNVNMVSALFAASAVVAILYSSWRLSGSLWSATLAAMLVALSRLFWSQAVIAEVYALNAFLFAGMVLLAIRWHERPNSSRLTWLALAVGLSLSHHPSAALMLPALLAMVAMRWRVIRLTLRSIIAVLGALFAPLLLYLYLPIRFLANPAMNYVGDYFDVNLASFRGLAWMISGRMFAEEVFGRSLMQGLAELRLLGEQLWLNLLGGGFLLAVYGLFKLRRRPGVVFLLGGSTALILLFFAFYNVVDSALMIHPALVLLAPAVAVGAQHLATGIRPFVPRRSLMIWPVGILAAGALSIAIAANWRFADRSEDFAAYEFASAIMKVVEPDALILTQWTSATPLEYVQIVERRRPDVEILDRGLFGLGVRDQLRRQGVVRSDEYGPFAVAVLTERMYQELQKRPVYITENDPVFLGSFCFEKLPEGIFRLSPVNESCRG